MSTTWTNDALGNAIMAAFRKEIERVANEEAEAAAERVKQRTRRSIAQIAASLHDHYSIERMGKDLVIRVKIEGSGE